MIECPETHKWIYTGLNMNWEIFESTFIGENSVPCNKCGKVHEWTRADAILDEVGNSS
jgi:hypothetical protein